MSSESGGLKPHIGFRSATALVIANVIGAGIFTTTGFQAADLGNPYLILLLWVIGGILAYCGALCYGELGRQCLRLAQSTFTLGRHTVRPSAS